MTTGTLALRVVCYVSYSKWQHSPVFQAGVVNKRTYANPAWYGFTTAADRGRLDSFLRRFVKLGYRDASLPSFIASVEELMNNCLW